VKFISYWEWDPKDTKAVIDKFMKRKYKLKVIFEPHTVGGQHKGITIFETDSIDEISDYITYYSPELKMKVFPLASSADTAKKWLEHHP